MRCFNCHVAISYVQVVDSQRKSMYGNSRKNRRELPYIAIVRI